MVAVFDGRPDAGGQRAAGRRDLDAVTGGLAGAPGDGRIVELPGYDGHGARARRPCCASARRVTIVVLALGAARSHRRRTQPGAARVCSSRCRWSGMAGIGGYLADHAQPGAARLDGETGAARSAAATCTRASKSARRPTNSTVLSASFNELLSRLDQSFETMRRFVADASHELRTPLSVIRGEADVALSQERGAAEYRESLAMILDESRRLSRLVDDLLNLARADSRPRGQLQDAGFLFQRSAGRVLPLRAGPGRCARHRAGVPCARATRRFTGDEELLRRMVMNLLDNAIRYTPRGGTVAAER